MDRAFVFGPFQLFPVRRTLLANDRPVRLGARALDLLVELVSRAGEVIDNDELLARVWGDVSVDEGNIRFHISALRRTLSEGSTPGRYIVNFPGRGYSFVAPVTASADEGATGSVAPERGHALPVALTRMIGRSDIVVSLISALPGRRFTTIVGPGGVGKTTVALAVAEAVGKSYSDGVRLIDLSPVGDAQLVPSAVASALGLTSAPSDPSSGIVAFLRDKRILVLLDSCEHVLVAAAALAERVLQHAPGVDILATSREPLRVQGEQLRRLPTLAVPPASSELCAEAALAFPAVELFTERAAAVLGTFELIDKDAPTVARICRRLDGMPLAIELVAGRVETFGISGLAAMLEDGFELFAGGGHGAVARHRTMSATLEWSFKWLSGPERSMLCRLSVFAGAFSLSAAQAVMANVELPGLAVAECLASLVGKSLVAADIFGPDVSYRLLDTTRSYAFAKLTESGQLDSAAGRHASYYREYLERTAGETHRIDEPVSYRDLLGNLRVALKWAFSENGDTQIAITLAAVSGPFLLQMSLLSECSAWTGRAIVALDDATRGGWLEMELQSSYGFALAYTTGCTKGAALGALGRALELALALKDYHRQVTLLFENLNLLIREGNFASALALAQKSELGGPIDADSANLVKIDMMLGNVHHMLGDQSSARLRYEAVVRRSATSHVATDTRIEVDSRIHALATLARIHWLEGYGDQAVASVTQVVNEARVLGHPLTLCVTLMSAASIYLWVGDLERATDVVASLIADAERYSFEPVLIHGHVKQAKLSLLNGDIDAGVSALEAFLEPANPYHDQWHNIFGSLFARGVARQGRAREALAYIDSFIAEVELNGSSMYLPDLLRAKGDILADTPGCSFLEAENWLQRSLDCARSQSVLAFELQAAISLARLWHINGRSSEARALLTPLYQRFTEGFETTDLRAAKSLLDQLS